MKPSKIRSLALLLLAALGASVAQAAPAAATPFKDHDRWAVIGDSITQGRTYYAWVYLYYATRFPTLQLDAYNCGISGDSASGALRRYDWDIQPHRATVATIMFGMNDVSRGLYGDNAPDEAGLKRRENALQAYRANLAELTAKLKADGARVVYVTPTPFDETADLTPARQPGVNGALARCATYMRELAAENGSEVIDLHGPMTELNLRLQKTDPKATIVGPDRIHPEIPGQFVMAYHILKGQGLPSRVSTVEIDAGAAKLIKADNAEVSGLARKDGVLAFTSFEKALPFPVPEDCRPALDWVPFQQDLNQEILRVTNLAPGSHALLIDGEPVAEFDASEFAAGINLALLRSAPQVRQAETVLGLVREWQKSIAYWIRGVAQVEHWKLKDEPRPISLESVRGKLEAELEQLKGSDKHMDKYNSSIIRTYLKVKPREAQSAEDVAALAAKIREAARPVPHRYEIR